MPLPADYQAEIVREVGDPNNTLAPLVATLWTLHADKLPIHVDLQYLYTKRSALDIRLAEEQPATQYQVSNEITSYRNQKFEHLQAMRDETQAEIVRIESVVRSSRAPKAAALTHTTPEVPPFPDSVDANSKALRGDPYIRLRRLN